MTDTEQSRIIIAAGGIILRENNNVKQVLIVHRNRYNDYSLPKGKLQTGETFEQAALREVYEETGYKCRITGIAGVQSRWMKDQLKIVVFFTMIPQENEAPGMLNQNKDDEVRETIWMNAENLEGKMSYAEQTELILKTINNSV